jgi:PKD repeat protein
MTPIDWTTAEQWEAGYKDYLAASLVQNVATTLSPASGRGVSLIEGLVAWYADLGDGALVLLGDRSSIKPVEAVAALRAAIGDVAGDGMLVDEIVEGGRSLDELHAELAAIAVAGEELADFATAVDGIFATCFTSGLPPPPTTSSAVAALVQGAEADAFEEHVVYISRLYTVVSQAEIDQLTGPELISLFNPNGDYDLDGITNAAELDASPAQSSDPTIADTDGDSLADPDDPCPRDPTNTCLLIPSQEGDADLDGVPDWIDNCMNDANADQLDGNDDGIGDACRRFANIRTPSSNLTVQTGSQVLFTSIVVTDPPTPPVLPLSYLWEFDGAHADSTLPAPGLLTLNAPGVYTISLTVTDATLTSVPADVRVVTVQGVPLVTMSVALDGPYVAAEGEAVHMAAAAESMHGTPEVFAWNFGDLTPAGSGTALTHVYAQQGSYDVTVTVMDDVGAMASESTTAEIADTAPAPNFDHAPGIEALEVLFADLSTAHDGIASWSWDFGDDTPPSADQHPVHVFPAPDVYVVSLTTVDGDGTVASASRHVAVGVTPIPVLSLWSAIFLGVLLAAAMWWLALTQGRRARPEAS